MNRLLVALACAAFCGLGCASSDSGVSEGWKNRGFEKADRGPLLHVAGNYYVRKVTYTQKGYYTVEQKLAVLRLYHKAPKAPEFVEVPLPDGYTVDPRINRLCVGPDGDSIMVPGTSVDTDPRPTLLTLVKGTRVGATFEPRRDEQSLFARPDFGIPMWSADGKRFALEAHQQGVDGRRFSTVFLFWVVDLNKVGQLPVEKMVGEGSYHFGGWSPSGDAVAVFEGFPEEEYTVGPDEMHHRILDRDFRLPKAKPVRLWKLDLKKNTAETVGSRLGGWVKGGKYDPGKSDLFHYRWTSPGDKLETDSFAKPPA